MGKRQDSEVLRKGEKSRQVWREAGKKMGKDKGRGNNCDGSENFDTGVGGWLWGVSR